MKLLLHACCGPCACYPTKILRSQDVDFTLLYYNPNIHPYKEFKHRLAALRELAEKQDYRLIIDKTYPLEECVKGMLEEPVVRCAFCYRMRLRYTAKYAADHGFTAFSTTLLYSPYQKHELILQIAKAAAEEFGVEFFYQDWRPHYQEGVDISLALGLYRWKKTKTEAGNTRNSNGVVTGTDEAEGKPFVRITKHIIQLPKQDTILYK